MHSKTMTIQMTEAEMPVSLIIRILQRIPKMQAH